MAAPSPEVVEALWSEWQRTAFHEAGHAVVSVAQGLAVEVAKVFYVGSGRRTEVRGYVAPADWDLRDVRVADAAVVIALAGPAAEAVWLRRHGWGGGGAQRAADEAAPGDFCNVTRYLRRSSITYGQGRRLAMQMVTRHWPGIQRTARALARRGYLPGSAVQTS